MSCSSDAESSVQSYTDYIEYLEKINAKDKEKELKKQKEAAFKKPLSPEGTTKVEVLKNMKISNTEDLFFSLKNDPSVGYLPEIIENTPDYRDQFMK